MSFLTRQEALGARVRCRNKTGLSRRASLRSKPSCSKALQEQACCYCKPEVVFDLRRLRKNTDRGLDVSVSSSRQDPESQSFL